MRAVLDAYTDETGITVLLTTEFGRSLVERITAEKHRATADLVILDSIGHLWTAVANDILRPSSSEILEENIPEKLRDPEKLWFALLVAGRTIVYDNRDVEAEQLTSYIALGDERWRGKLCLGTVKFNQARPHSAFSIHHWDPMSLSRRAIFPSILLRRGTLFRLDSVSFPCRFSAALHHDYRLARAA